MFRTIFITLMLSFSLHISAQSDSSIVLITPIQLKETNLIFAEHWKLLQQNSLLLNQIRNYEEENSLFIKADSIKTLQLQNYKELSDAYSLKIDNLNKEILNKNRTIKTLKIGGITITVGLVIWLLLK